jgi:hypothetical protein
MLKKRLIALAIAAPLVAGLAACGESATEKKAAAPAPITPKEVATPAAPAPQAGAEAAKPAEGTPKEGMAEAKPAEGMQPTATTDKPAEEKKDK